MWDVPAANIVEIWAQNTLYPLRVPGSLYYFLAQCDKINLVEGAGIWAHGLRDHIRLALLFLG